MHSDALIAFSAGAAALSGAGALIAVRADNQYYWRSPLIGLFLAFGGLVTIPLVVAFVRAAYVFYLPLALPLLFCLPPLMHRYVAAAAATEPEPPRFCIRDVVLPATGSLVVFGFWLLPGRDRSTMLIEGQLPPGLAPSILALSVFVLVTIWVVASFGYLIASLRRLALYRRRLKDTYSNTAGFELRWIEWFIALLVAVWAAAAFSLLSDNYGPGSILPVQLVFALAAGLILLLILFGSNISTLPQSDTQEAELEADAPKDKKYARSSLSPDHAERLATRIEAAMQEAKLYLDPNLSLTKLSRHVGAAPNLVSQTLNEEIGSTFFDYVAHWRIEAAKPLILAGDASVLDVALHVGFNTRSTFYKAFKRETGMTPSAYKSASDPNARN